jgi:histidine triad (HIT) family protein
MFKDIRGWNYARYYKDCSILFYISHFYCCTGDTMTNQDCIFCKIINNEIPAAKVYEDEQVLAFLDINPVNPGHTLVIPKEHHETLLEMTEQAVDKVFNVGRKIASTMKEALDAPGVNIAMNVGEAAGQVVFHAHLHVMPRFEGDGHALFKGKPYPDGEMEKVQEKLKAGLD